MQIQVDGSNEPMVLLVLSAKGMERAVILYREGDPEGLEQGAGILAKVAVQLALLDEALRD
jgi:hypothetical protein